MTLPAPGVPLSLQQINAEFGLGTNLGVYRGVRWWTNSAATGVFPTTNISINDFYSKRATSPVSPSTTTYATPGTYTFTVPLYSSLYVVVRGASGGGGGGDSNGGIAPTDGTAGNYSQFGLSNQAFYLVGLGGAGGYGGNTNPAPAGGPTSDGSPPGGAGGSSGYVGYSAGGQGGAGGLSQNTFYSPVNGGIGPSVGAQITVIVGSKGTGGSGGDGLIYNPADGKYYPANGGNGANGIDGSVTIYVT